MKHCCEFENPKHLLNQCFDLSISDQALSIVCAIQTEVDIQLLYRFLVFFTFGCTQEVKELHSRGEEEV